MLTRTAVQSRPWRFFAIFWIMIAAPLLLAPGSSTGWLKSSLIAVALVGLAGYAFGFRVGPLFFWRGFAILFSMIMMAWLGARALPALSSFPNPVPGGGLDAKTFGIGFVFFALLCLALFRHSGLVPAVDRPRDEKPVPLLQRQSVHWSDVLAKAKAAAERPMTPAMEAEVSACGPHRRLSVKQHQRITSVLLVGTVIAQAALAILYGGATSILAPAIVLGIGSAIATYHSGEVIARAQASLSPAWKALLVLSTLCAASFLPFDTVSAKLWLARAVLIDGFSFLLGSLSISTLYALRHR